MGPHTADFTLNQCKKRSDDDSRKISGSIQLANYHRFWLYIQEPGAASRKHLVTECSTLDAVAIPLISNQ